MKLPRLFPVIVLLALVTPICAQMEPAPEADALLAAASKALDHWQQLAPKIHCEDVTQVQLREDCKGDILGMGDRVQEAKTQIARYRQLSKPQVVDLFDAYESFRRVMQVAEDMNIALYFYGERNQKIFAETYNTFVKVNGWFGGVVRASIEKAAKCSERAPT